jgi:hypothetical protein
VAVGTQRQQTRHEVLQINVAMLGRASRAVQPGGTKGSGVGNAQSGT